MKTLIFAFFLIFTGLSASAQTKPQQKTAKQQTVIRDKVVEIACGECKFGLKGKSCDSAVSIDGMPYFVDGKKIDDFGDAHDEKHGFCNVISKATVTGEIVNNRFKAEKIALISDKKD